MYFIHHSRQYKKSLRKIIKSGRYKISDISLVDEVINKISSGGKLDEKYEDHQLHGKMSTYRECHIKNNLLLVYELNKKELILITVDIGSHSEIFG